MKTDPVQALLEDLCLVDEGRFQIVLSLRRLILSVDPGISDSVKYGGLLFAAGSPFCGVFAYSRHVSLEFSRGADLADPHAVLEGDGKKRRHIKIGHRDEIFKKNVREYVQRAFEATTVATQQQRRTRPRG